MVNVCDAIMGSGKSSAAITYINEHPEKRFVYVTPYLDEAHRIAVACPRAEFVEPCKQGQFHWSKTVHTADLIASGRNIASTHSAFRYYTRDMLDTIQEKKYVLIMDEACEALEGAELRQGDLRLLKAAGAIEANEDGSYREGANSFKDSRFEDALRLVKSRDIIVTAGETGSGKESFCWRLPPDLFMAFAEVYVLTYMFEGQSLSLFLKMHNITYQKIGVARDVDGTHRFSDHVDYIPEYVGDLTSKLHILEHARLNRCGDRQGSLSASWYKRSTSDVEQVKKNIYNFFRNIMGDKGVDQRMWSTYKSAKTKVRGKGYSNCFVPLNERATNNYREKTVLAYCVNVHFHTGQKMYYRRHGVQLDENMYALSTMVQWIWRSAIRDGKEVWVYVPSKRMRNLLQDWIEETSKMATEHDGGATSGTTEE